jgi:hypothetical protein
VPPEYALGAAAAGWGEDLYQAVVERQQEKARAAAEAEG